MNDYAYVEMWDEPNAGPPQVESVNFWQQARTLRERTYLRLISATPVILAGINFQATTPLAHRIRAVQQNPEWRHRFMGMPIAHLANYRGRATSGVELTLHVALQDLGDLIAMEADDAFHAAYYPRLPHVFFPEDRVALVMASLQREVDGEAHSRKKVAPQFSTLPWDRQCALAERRRMWFYAYGLTEHAFRRGTWSLWRVKPIPCPIEELKAKKLGL